MHAAAHGMQLCPEVSEKVSPKQRVGSWGLQDDGNGGNGDSAHRKEEIEPRLPGRKFIILCGPGSQREKHTTEDKGGGLTLQLQVPEGP